MPPPFPHEEEYCGRGPENSYQFCRKAKELEGISMSELLSKAMDLLERQ